MRADLQCLSWWIRRMPRCEDAGFFFRDALGLPLFFQQGNNWGARQAIFVFWGGECVEVEFLPGASERPRYERPEEQDEVPVFRTFDLAAAESALEAGGARVLRRDDDAHGRTVWFCDPGGSVNGIRQAPATSTEAIDLIAGERYATGGTRLPGTAPMPPAVSDLGWVRVHVVDVPAETAFYRDVLGLDVLTSDDDEATLSLGDVARLELRAGGRRHQPPADRAEVPEAWMLRVHDMPAVVQRLRDAGARFVNEPFEMTGGEMAYVLDSEGHLFGIQDHGDDGRPQEQEAWRRWRALQSS